MEGENIKILKFIKTIPAFKHLDFNPDEGEIKFLEKRIIVMPADVMISIIDAITEIAGENVAYMFMRKAGLKTGAILYSMLIKAGLIKNTLRDIAKGFADFSTLSGWGKFYIKDDQVIGENLVYSKPELYFIKGFLEGLIKEANLRGVVEAQLIEDGKKVMIKISEKEG